MSGEKKASPTERLEGSIERVTYHNEDTGFCVLKVNIKGRRNPVAVVGKIPHIVAGEWIDARGQWVVDREHGRQFKASEIRATPPTSLEGIERFLGSGLIKGVGPVYARKLVNRFGLDVLEVIDKHSAQLEKVPGIGRMRRMQIKEGWNEAKYVREIMTFLMSYGVSTNRAFRIYKTYGEQAITCVRSDPYCLARDIRGIGFHTADEIARRMDIHAEHPLRARAGLEHVLDEATGQGHCAVPEPMLMETAEQLLNIPEDILRKALDSIEKSGRIFRDADIAPPDTLVYLKWLYHIEKNLAEHLAAYASAPAPYPAIDIEKAIPWVEARMKLQLADAQRQALRQAFRSKFMIITGGPGVGKTTLIKAIMDIAKAKKMRIVQCAPTGRAAKRMTELTGHEAKTIHRLLAFDPGTGRFRHNAQHPLSGDLFIIDESSMIDLPLAWHLMSALPPESAAVWVGDADQLPSVGPGCVLKDLIVSDCFNVCRLTHIFRQAGASRIITAAHEINSGRAPDLTDRPDSDFYFIEENDPDVVARKVLQMCSRAVPRKFGMDPIDDIQVLTPMQKGSLGVIQLGRLLQDQLNPRGETVERFGISYRIGDKVMQLENNYDKDVFNGDIGVIDRIDREENEVVIAFRDKRVHYSLHEMDELTPCYAVTIHKSQGSEYPCVIVVLHTQHYVMLERNLLYTAITRGKKLVVLIGSRKALEIAVRRTNLHDRRSALTARLTRGSGGNP